MSFISFAFLTTVLVKAIFASGDYDTDLDWRPIFKVSAGAKDQWYYDSTSNLFDWWKDESKSTYDNMEDDFNAAKSIDPSRIESTNYKSLIVNNWFNLRYEQMCFDLVRVSVFKDGREVAYIVFSAFESYNNEDWFDRNQIESTSWYDLPSGHTCPLPLAIQYIVDINVGCVFSVKGDINTGANRNFYINRNYGGCPNDDGWLGISTQDRCFDGWNPDELADGQPTIHYSKNNVIGNFANDREHDTADTFVVSINGYGCDNLDVPTNEPTEEPGRSDDDNEGCLEYINTYFSHDNWHCSSQSDGEINSILNDRCDLAHPGSRSITGNDLLNNGYMNIVGLPDSVPFGFLPSCPACGINGDDLGCSIGGRLYIDSFSSSEEWNNFPQDWNIYTNGDSFSYICIYDNCITPSPTQQPRDEDDNCIIYGGNLFLHADPQYEWSCNTQTDDEIDAILDTACSNYFPGSRSITGEDIIDYGYEYVVGLVDALPTAQFSFLPSCPGCGNGGIDFGCSGFAGSGSRLGVDVSATSEEWSDYPDNWDLLQSGSSMRAVCVYDNCNQVF